MFQSQGRFFWGADTKIFPHIKKAASFNRRGDSFGGLTWRLGVLGLFLFVSIAGAILLGG